MKKFINPRIDYAFKKIFGSESSKNILISFLNAVLNFEGEHRIVDLEILDPYSLPKIKGLKESCVDVKVKTVGGQYIIVKMQVLSHPGFDKRVLYNTVKQYANQIEKAEDFLRLNPVIGLTITDFVFFKETEKYISYFVLKEKTEEFEYSGDLELVFVELPKFEKNISELFNTMEKWMYFLKKADYLDDIPRILKEDPDINHAFEMAHIINLNREELEILEKRGEFIGIQKALRMEMSQSYEKGVEKGIEIAMRRLIDSGISEREAKKILNIG